MSREQRITDFHQAAAIQTATLEELRKRFHEDGMDEEAKIVGRALGELAMPGDPGEKVAKAMPHIRSLRVRMREIGEPELAKAVEHVRRVLGRYADKTLEDTQEIDVDEIGLRKP